MATEEVDAEALRRLAEMQAVGVARVLSVYLNLDPAELPTTEARATAVTSVATEAERVAREDEEGLEHDVKMALREDVERVRRALEEADFHGAQGMAVFACGPADLLEVLALPRPVDTEVHVSDAPWIEPLVGLAQREDVVVALVSRREGRILVGNRDGLEEVADAFDDTHGQHSQGGWSQGRYERSIDEDTKTHLKRVDAVLRRRLRRRPFDRLFFAAPDEVVHGFEEILSAELRGRLTGRLSLDQHARPDEVRAAVAAALDDLDRDREGAALERLRAGVGSPDGRAAGGLQEVLDALYQRRVEILLYAEGFGAPGLVDPESGWMAAEGADTAAAGGAELQRYDNVLEPAIEVAVQQAAEVMPVRHRREELEALGGIGAVLRY